jgi:hypothetical protein
MKSKFLMMMRTRKKSRPKLSKKSRLNGST